MQFTFPLILIGALGVGLAVLVRMGWSRRRRTRRLIRIAHEMGMRFSPADPFDLMARYSTFMLVQAGHSSRAENVIYGRCEGWHLRAFDYYFEVGHGPRRLARRYSVIVADTDLNLPGVLMWSDGDAEYVPLAVRSPVGRIGKWLVLAPQQVVGQAEMNFAETLADAFKTFADGPVDLQTSNRSVMLCSTVRWKPSDVADALARAAAGLQRLRERLQ